MQINCCRAIAAMNLKPIKSQQTLEMFTFWGLLWGDLIAKMFSLSLLKLQLRVQHGRMFGCFLFETKRKVVSGRPGFPVIFPAYRAFEIFPV